MLNPCRPNVVFISCHDLGRHLGCYGRADVASPNLDRLAAQGSILKNLFAANPICSPARGAMLSGLYPHRNGLEGLVHHGWRLKPGVRLVDEWFHDAGYRTALVGTQHERPKAERLPMDEVWTESTHAADVAPRVAGMIKDYARQRSPFFLRVGFTEVHRPLLRESDEGWESVTPLPYLHDTPEHRKQLAKYHKLIERADAAVGQILTALDENNLAADTLVVFTTDHGIPFPGAKLTLYDPGIEIACLMRLPGRIRPGTEVTTLLSGVDMHPTLLDLCGIEADVSGLDGKSFAPCFDDAGHRLHDYIFAERSLPVLMRCARTEQYKYIVNFDTLPPSHRLGAEEMRTNLCEAMPDRLRGNTRPEELYDVLADPHESIRLEDSPEHAGILYAMRSETHDWMRKTDDPILKGPPASPAFYRALDRLKS